jgi:hypothetical protein
MHGTLPPFTQTHRETERRLSQGTDKIVAPPQWVGFARFLFPEKTALRIAEVVHGRNTKENHVRTALRWMSGEFDPPLKLMRFLQDQLYERPGT